MYKEKIIAIPIYDGLMKIVVCNDLKEFNDNNNGNYNASDMFAFTTWVEQKRNEEMRSIITVCFNPDRKFYDDTIVHECYHACVDFLTGLGVKNDDDNQEPFAYMIAWMFTEVKKALKDMEAKNE